MVETQSKSIVHIAQKIWQLREDVKTIEASQMTAGKAKYNYLSESTITNALRPAMQKLKLVIIPVDSVSKTEVFNLVSPRDGQHETKSVLLSQVDSKYLLIDTESDEWIILASSASGADNMDKGTNKAKTGAFKNVLQALGMFASPEKDDPDTTPSSGGGNSSSNGDAGTLVLKYGEFEGKTIKEVWDMNPEAVEKMATYNNFQGKKAKEFLATIK